jgi:hypothetical protein
MDGSTEQDVRLHSDDVQRQTQQTEELVLGEAGHWQGNERTD